MTPQERKVFELALEALIATIPYVEKEAFVKVMMARDAVNEALAQPDRHELQAKGEHPAPCARFCEANSFQIEIRSLKKQLEQAQNGWCKALEKLQIQPDKVCIENDGCPTEKAVLQRFWREHQKTKPEQEPVAHLLRRQDRSGYETGEKTDYGAIPVYTHPQPKENT